MKLKIPASKATFLLLEGFMLLPLLKTRILSILKRSIFLGSRTRMVHEFGFATLDIFEVTAEDGGVYTCRATNVIGSAETYATVIVQRKFSA